MNTAFSFLGHTVGMVLWFGGLLAMSRVLVALAKEPSARSVLGPLAGKLNILALLGAVLTLGCGLYQLSLWPTGAFRHTHWMHHKLTLVLVVVVVHGLLMRTQKRWSNPQHTQPLSRGLASGLHGVVGLALIGILATVYLSSAHFLRMSTGL